MKSTREIFEFVREKLIKDTHITGLCYIVKYSNLDRCEKRRFQEIYQEFIETRTTFYNFQGEETLKKDQFAWISGDVENRLKWIDSVIEDYSTDLEVRFEYCPVLGLTSSVINKISI